MRFNPLALAGTKPNNMLVKTNRTTKSGRTIYVNAFTGRDETLSYGKPNRGGRIPDGVYHRFIKPAPTELERMQSRNY